ncbi:MAG: Na+/H+ antiporter NhaA, partial [Pseudomonadota bacterium]
MQTDERLPPADPHDRRFHAPWERPLTKILTPFEEFIQRQTTGSVILMICLAIALALANSPWAAIYHDIINTPISVAVGAFKLEKTLHYWVNEGLMALFFFVVGLEIKRAILVGELSSPRQAALPIIAAVGGMLVPALIYFAINPEGVAARGWGIPMATDIAIAVGALVLLGSRIPRSLVMFLVALAIVDDLGAVLVIALFYTEQIALHYLGAALLLWLVLIVFNLGGIRNPLPYFLVAVALWLMLLQSGVHATIAGVLGAFAVPARPKYDPAYFSRHLRDLMDRFDAHQRAEKNIMVNTGLYSIVQTVEHSAEIAQTPLQRLERFYHLPVALLVVPVFALTNAGVALDSVPLADALRHPVTLGVIAGLVLGKFIGITGVCWLALKLNIGRFPEHTTFHHIVGAGLLAGIGFTMSLFIAEMGFAQSAEHLLMAKVGILCASLIAVVAGYVWLLLSTRVSKGAPTI